MNLIKNFRTKIEESRANNSQILNVSIGLASNQSSRFSETSSDTDSRSTYTYVCIYGALMASLFVVALTRSMGFFHFCMSSAQNLHDKIFTSLVSATMRFFNTNPSGRILNRF